MSNRYDARSFLSPTMRSTSTAPRNRNAIPWERLRNASIQHSVARRMRSVRPALSGDFDITFDMSGMELRILNTSGVETTYTRGCLMGDTPIDEVSLYEEDNIDDPDA